MCVLMVKLGASTIEFQSVLFFGASSGTSSFIIAQVVSRVSTRGKSKLQAPLDPVSQPVRYRCKEGPTGSPFLVVRSLSLQAGFEWVSRFHTGLYNVDMGHYRFSFGWNKLHSLLWYYSEHVRQLRPRHPSTRVKWPTQSKQKNCYQKIIHHVAKALRLLGCLLLLTKRIRDISLCQQNSF